MIKLLFFFLFQAFTYFSQSPVSRSYDSSTSSDEGDESASYLIMPNSNRYKMLVMPNFKRFIKNSFLAIDFSYLIIQNSTGKNVSHT
jgi:hypothetical protein